MKTPVWSKIVCFVFVETKMDTLKNALISVVGTLIHVVSCRMRGVSSLCWNNNTLYTEHKYQSNGLLNHENISLSSRKISSKIVFSVAKIPSRQTHFEKCHEKKQTRLRNVMTLIHFYLQKLHKLAKSSSSTHHKTNHVIQIYSSCYIKVLVNPWQIRFSLSVFTHG